jgi:iron complex transport system substrate-binding protein
MIQSINEQLNVLDHLPQAANPPTAFWYSSNGVVIGAGTLEHELMLRAGLRNLAAERGIFGFATLDLELLIAAKPQYLIIEESNVAAYSLAREYLAHPLLSHSQFTIIRLPAGLSGCAATAVEEVALALKNQLNPQTKTPH